MARLKTFAQDLQLATAGIAPQNIAAELAKFARSELAAVIADGTGSSNYNKFVNGHEGADEGTVVPPGPIVYDFIWWEEIVVYALQFLVERGPQRTFWAIQAIMADPGRRQAGVGSQNNRSGLPGFLGQPQPYSRKIDVGHMHMSVPHGIIEDARTAVMSIFGNMITAKRTMIQLPGGYILKGHFRRGVRPHSRTKLRKDVMAGMPMTYPTLLLQMRR
jgi:hypothetical protein